MDTSGDSWTVFYAFTPANVAENIETLLQKLLYQLSGQCFEDKGYITTLFEGFYEQGLKIVTKIRENMKNEVMVLNDKINLKKRALIESVNDLLMSVFDIDIHHSRHRNPINVLAHTFSGLAAYCFYENKPFVLSKTNPELTLFLNIIIGNFFLQIGILN